MPYGMAASPFGPVKKLWSSTWIGSPFGRHWRPGSGSWPSISFFFVPTLTQKCVRRLRRAAASGWTWLTPAMTSLAPEGALTPFPQGSPLVTEQLPGPRAFSRPCRLADLLVRPWRFPSGRLVRGEYQTVAGAAPSLARCETYGTLNSIWAMAGPSPVTWPSLMDSVQEPSFWSFAKTVGERLIVIWMPPLGDGARSMRMSSLMPARLHPTRRPAWAVGVLPKVVRVRADRSCRQDFGRPSPPNSSVGRPVHGIRPRGSGAGASLAGQEVLSPPVRPPVAAIRAEVDGSRSPVPRRHRAALKCRQGGSDVRWSTSVSAHEPVSAMWVSLHPDRRVEEAMWRTEPRACASKVIP